jgi:hypothetical protein
MPYYVLDSDATPFNRVTVFPRIKQNNWLSGERLKPGIPEPLEFKLEPTKKAGVMREFYDSRMPLMREDLVEALREAGVDNLEVFDATLHDPTRGTTYTNYKAVNIVGAIACLDREKAKVIPGMDSDMIDMGLESAPIDESKAGGALLFRLAENVSMILVHEKVKKHLEARGFKYLTFVDPAEWSG